MNKNLILFFAIIICTSQLISSLEIGVNPAYINLETRIGEKICRNITIYANKEISIIIRDKWTDIKGSRNIRDYNLSSDDIEIKVTSQNKVLASSDKKAVWICFSGKEKGDFYGAVLFESENWSLTAGSWVNLNITYSKKDNSNLLTGAGIRIINGNNFLIPELIILSSEVIILFFLIRKMRAKRKNSQDL